MELLFLNLGMNGKARIPDSSLQQCLPSARFIKLLSAVMSLYL